MSSSTYGTAQLERPLLVKSSGSRSGLERLPCASIKRGGGCTISGAPDIVGNILKQAGEKQDWIRCHNKTRRSKFTPMKVSKGPKDPKDVGSLRVSMLYNDDTRQWSIDVEDWRNLANPHQIIQPMRGYTAFMNDLHLPQCRRRDRYELSG